jgi:hypothetical protein
LREQSPARFKRISRAASDARFRWSDSAEAYLRDLYTDAAPTQASTASRHS